MVDSVGAGVTAFKLGDRVLISCISACGKCEYCRRGMYSHCTTGGWILGNEHMLEAYDTFGRAAETRALEVIIDA